MNAAQSGRGGIPSYQYFQGRREVAFYRAGYAAEVALADAAIGALLDGVRARGLLSGATVVFAADHGEGLGEDDYWVAHGELLSDPLVRVPLMLRSPGVAPGRRDELVSLVDLFPTLLQRLAGVPPDPQAPGRDLLAEGAESRPSRPYLANLAGGEVPRYGLVEGEFKFVTTLRDGVWDGSLYRRGREDADLAAGAPQVAREMRRKLDALRAGIERRVELPQSLSAEDRERLRELGYVEAPEAAPR